MSLLNRAVFDTSTIISAVLLRLNFDAYTSSAERSRFFARYKQETTLLTPDAPSEQMAEGASRDPKDSKSLAIAMAFSAGASVSSDDDVLSLRIWQGAQIISPAAFLSRTMN